MNFKLNFEIPKSPFSLTYDEPFVLLGSCFSDEIGDKIYQAGFDVESNTFGTLFHPIAMANVVESSLNENQSVDVYQRDDLFFSWDAASKIYAESEVELISKVLEARRLLCTKIKEAGVIVFTFGTAWKYNLSSSGKVVGNCHKAPQSLFNKSLSTVEEMKSEWENVLSLIRKQNPNVKIIFTVSPVRHIKDGLIENNRSKSRLIELVNELVSLSDAYYFPSYEILIDELRDYRFYGDDFVHPNKTAIQYIWERFKETLLSEDTNSILKEREQIVAQLNHKSLHPGSQVELKRLAEVKLRCEEFQLKYPKIRL